MVGIRRVLIFVFNGLIFLGMFSLLSTETQAQNDMTLELLQEAREKNLELTKKLIEWQIKDVRNRQYIEELEQEVKDARERMKEIINSLRTASNTSRGPEETPTPESEYDSNSSRGASRGGENKARNEAMNLNILTDALSDEVDYIRRKAAAEPDFDFPTARLEAKTDEMVKRMSRMQRLINRLKEDNSRLRKENDKLKNGHH